MTKLVLFLLPSLLLSKVFYTMQDLEVLSKQNELEEYLVHAKDIPPSKRGKKWKEMTHAIGLKYLEKLTSSSELSNKQEAVLDNIKNWNVFKNDEIFNRARRPLSLKKLELCFAKKLDSCMGLAMGFQDKDPLFNYQIAKIFFKQATYNQQSYKLYKFIKPLLSSNICSFYSSEEAFTDIFYTTITLEPRLLSNKTVDKDCLKKFSGELKTSLYTITNSEKRSALKKILSSWGVLTTKDKHFYNIKQFLADHKMSKLEIVNNWNSLRTMAKDSKLRSQVTGDLLNSNNLEGKILTNKSKSGKAILKALARYTPEYFTQFASRCLDYFKGKGDIPSSYCHQLLSQNEIDILSPLQKQEYSSILKQYKKN